MSRNRIHFQKGMSLHEFQEQYGTDERCREALFRWRWPGGYVCPMCGYHKGCEIKSRKVYQCHKCHYQTSLTAGTVFDSTRVPLTVWFLGMYILIQSKNGISTMEMMRQLGISYNAAWRMRHKLMQVMYERDERRKLGGVVELDDAYLGGERSGEKRGRGTPGKIPFLAAVDKNEKGHPISIKLTRVTGFRKEEIESWSIENLLPGSTIVTDGLNCFSGVEAAGCKHIIKKVGSHKQAAMEPAFKWVNTVLGNLKNAIKGTYHVIYSKYSHRYLAEFQYRVNRRFDLSSLVPRLACVAVRTQPRPEWLLKLAEI